MSAPKPFDWVAEAGMLRGELMALELFLLSDAVSKEHVLQQVQKGLRESQRRLDEHFAASETRHAAQLAQVPLTTLEA